MKRSINIDNVAVALYQNGCFIVDTIVYDCDVEGYIEGIIDIQNNFCEISVGSLYRYFPKYDAFEIGEKQ